MFTFLVNLFTCILHIGEGDLRRSPPRAPLEDRDDTEEEDEEEDIVLDLEDSDDEDGDEDDEELDELEYDEDEDLDLLEDLSRLRRLVLRAMFPNVCQCWRISI